MKIYDMHIHVDTGTPDSAKLLADLQNAGVYGGGIISAAPVESKENLLSLDYRDRVKNVLEWCKGSDDRLIPMLWVNPFEKDIKAKIRDAKESGIRAFKIICENHYVYCKENMEMLAEIEKTGLPVLFHTGILWSGKDSSKYNKPVDWECMLEFNKTKFALAHCSWPWYDECIAVYGKFLESYNHRQSSEMFFDLTPGTPEIYRRDLITKLFTVGYDVADNIMFGTDQTTVAYRPDWTKKWLKIDGALFDELGVDDATREKIYNKNYMRFLSGGDITHDLPKMGE